MVIRYIVDFLIVKEMLEDNGENVDGKFYV